MQMIRGHQAEFFHYKPSQAKPSYGKNIPSQAKPKLHQNKPNQAKPSLFDKHKLLVGLMCINWRPNNNRVAYLYGIGCDLW